MRKSRQPRCTAAISIDAAREDAEATGRRPKFELNDFPRGIAGPATAAYKCLEMARS
jgi:hypothetical protein